MPVIDTDLIGSSRHAYLIGIGGVGMSALGRVLKHQGLRVSGSDSKESATTYGLRESGIPVFIGQASIGYSDADLIIYSSAISSEHLELKTARESGLRVYHRAEILSSLLNRARTSIAVTGTHGKTTTSSMISFVLSELGKKPTCLVGGDVVNLGTNTVLGDPNLWVSEVDESDKSHELYAPNYAIITNLEEDHIDNYKNLEDLRSSFERFLSNMRNPGLVVYSADDAGLERLVEESGKPHVSFGFLPSADFSAQNVTFNDFGSQFDLCEAGFFVRRVRLSVPGFHNIANALAATALLTQVGLDVNEIAETIAHFRGARRRLEVKWKSQDGETMVIDDYAHHPTEVKASLRALRALGKHLTVIFQPHRYSRTQYFFRQFATAFDEADDLILTDIYGAGEPNTANISVKCIYDEMAGHHQHVQMLEKKKIVEHLMAQAEHKGIFAFLGAGDIGEFADEFANRYKKLTPA